ncbi:hypothetical protein ZOSMA_65G00450 [Zostera marina]|uniref:DDE Tnp4 domain-containing protein n=1 Tax=Zostera marina TaxID=29655 RepID=A0A0K9NSX6_ZOSMR|nr:hypothetical protein ZOSMA_65G00450 [Zostera marina]
MNIPIPSSSSDTSPSPTPTPAADDDYTFYYSFFQEDSTVPGLDMPVAVPQKCRDEGDGESEKQGRGGKKKRKKKYVLEKLASTMMILEEEAKIGKRESEMEYREEMVVSERNHMDVTRDMLDIYSHTQDYYSDLEESDALRTKRLRQVSASVATAVVAEGMKEDETGVTQRQHPRRVWKKERSGEWWEKYDHRDFPDSEFKSAFRMGKATFDFICSELKSAVEKEDTMLRTAIPARQRVAVCIWRLATGEPLRLVSKRFGLGISTCHKLVLEVCIAIRNVLMPKYLQWPNDHDGIIDIKSKFESISGIPNLIGSMYTTHIPIIAPKINVGHYYNKRHTERNHKTSYSITVQGVVDSAGVFTDVCIGYPGSMPDDEVLEKSALFKRGSNGLLNNQWIVGGSGYPLMDWVMIPYSHQNLTWAQHAFNGKIGDVQRIAKEAFARLKGRWKCLQKRTEVKLLDLPALLGACCVLHNVCESRNEEMDPNLRFELVDDEMIPANPLRSLDTMQVRDNIAHMLFHHGHAGTTFF